MVTLIKDVLKKYLEEDLGVHRASDELSANRAWNALEAKEVLNNTAFDKFVDGTVFINAKNPAWAQRVSLMKNELIAKLNERSGKMAIKDIRVRPGSIGQQTPHEAEREPSKCGRCGVEHRSGGENCPACARELKQGAMMKIFRLVNSDPKVTLSEARKALPGLGSDEFRKIKRDMNSLKWVKPGKEVYGGEKERAR